MLTLSFLLLDAIEAQGYRNFVSMVFGDDFGGWPMIQNSWDGTKFSTEKVAGDNLRSWLSSTLISVYAYLDSFDTSRNVLYVSDSLTRVVCHCFVFESLQNRAESLDYKKKNG